MSEKKRAPEEERERLRQEELKGNPTGNIRDSLNRTDSSGNFADLFGGLGWKGALLVLLALIVVGLMVLIII
ncbi:DUF6366 family protein [Oceanobacillus sp. J11TS1]|uniref:DUF6366 family protein n=1 Tax=Oceanobacillus sp. J11TS1 TaxID=2807191 RepID=UPI001B12170E|nr:DUF6366 family protein [Oceanobacillus sp. J11TS1]GIO23539.1 hypothetical protein J11TS1_21200 [Oceanobacillus sp. J11TS1]